MFYPCGFLIEDLRMNQVLLKRLVEDGLYPLHFKSPISSPVSFVATKLSRHL